MGRALGLILIAVASGLAIYWLVVPFVLPTPMSHTNLPPPGQNRATETPLQPTASRLAAMPEHHASAPPEAPDAALAPPRTAQQRATDDLESKRAPFYRWVREQGHDRISDLRPADDDGATLVIYTAYDSADVAVTIVRDLVAPEAFNYGFRHVRFFVPNPPGSVSQYRFAAEANSETNGAWHTFQK